MVGEREGSVAKLTRGSGVAVELGRRDVDGDPWKEARELDDRGAQGDEVLVGCSSGKRVARRGPV